MLSDAQLACAAVAAAPILVGAMWALGDLAGHIAAQKSAPSPARVARSVVGMPAYQALRLACLIAYAAEAILDFLFPHVDRAMARLDKWMDVR